MEIAKDLIAARCLSKHYWVPKRIETRNWSKRSEEQFIGQYILRRLLKLYGNEYSLRFANLKESLKLNLLGKQ